MYKQRINKICFLILCGISILLFFKQNILSSQEKNFLLQNHVHDEVITLPSLVKREEWSLLGTVQTEPISTSLVFYNRVPKCGSSSMSWIIRKMKEKLKFEVEDVSRPLIKQFMNDTEQVKVMQEIGTFPRDTLYIRHIHFLDFKKSPKTWWPVYINILRDPVERFISHYYFMRYGFQRDGGDTSNKWFLPMNEEKRSMSIEECLLKFPKDCVERNSNTILSFFCGQDKICRTYSDNSLAIAKENLVNHYQVVGILEDIPNTLKVLKAILPRYFGADLNISEASSIIHQTKTFNKAKTPDYVKSKLREALRVEVELYELAKKRFYFQLEKLKSLNQIQ